MIYTFSQLVEKYKTQKSFDKWVDSQLVEIERLSYEQPIIEKASIRNQQDMFESVKKAYKPLKALRKKSADYDAKFMISKQGYVEIEVIFPFTEKEVEKAILHRKEKVEELDKKFGGHDGCLCYHIHEAFWDLYHDKIYKIFNFTEYNHNGRHYFVRHNGNAIRKMGITKFI